jgi:hypothetical protein
MVLGRRGKQDFLVALLPAGRAVGSELALVEIIVVAAWSHRFFSAQLVFKIAVLFLEADDLIREFHDFRLEQNIVVRLKKLGEVPQPSPSLLRVTSLRCLSTNLQAWCLIENCN